MRVVIARSLRLCIRPPGADHLESLEIMADKTVKELKHVVCVWKMITQIGARTLVVTAARIGLVFGDWLLTLKHLFFVSENSCKLRAKNK